MSKFIDELLKGQNLEVRIKSRFYTNYINDNFPERELSKKEVIQAENFAEKYSKIAMQEVTGEIGKDYDGTITIYATIKEK